MPPALRRTALTARHAAAGATLAPFAGWELPLRFAGTLVEHRAVREHVGVFDVSHLGVVEVTGPDALGVIAESFTNDPHGVIDGASQYTLCCDPDGGVVDDLLVYRVDAGRWLAIPNAANTAAVLGVLTASAADRRAEVRDRSFDTALLAVQGPRSLEVLDDVLESLTGRDHVASAIGFLHLTELEVAGAPAVVARTGYTGEPGAELILAPDVAGEVWDAVRGAGAAACGLGARDTLRMEVGFPLHGHELTRQVTPYEGGVGWAVKLDRPAFRGRDALVEAKERGPRRVIRGLLPVGRRPVREGMRVTADGDEVGVVTSGTVSPTLNRPIALARLAPRIEPGATVQVDVRGRSEDAEVVRPPFLRRDPRGTPPAEEDSRDRR